MPDFCVEAIEKFLVRTRYYVAADSKEEAERLCRQGKVAYETKTILEDSPGSEWVETVSIEE